MIRLVGWPKHCNLSLSLKAFDRAPMCASCQRGGSSTKILCEKASGPLTSVSESADMSCLSFCCNLVRSDFFKGFKGFIIILIISRADVLPPCERRHDV